MAQVINTNSLSLLTQNNLNKSQSALNTAIERLSSGMRINSAKDDAAGQAIANRFTANIKGLTQATRNANDGISIAQTTEGALTEVNNNLQRVRELSVQAANGTNSASDLDSIQAEITQRLDEINRVSEQTQFNGVKVLSADAGKLTVQVGANDGETIDIDLQEISAKTLGLEGFNVNGTGAANKASTSQDLLAAGYTAGTVTNGTTAYSRTYGASDKPSLASMLSKVGTGGTVAQGGVTYTSNGTDYTYADAARTAANVAADLKPAAGGSTSVTIKIGGTQTIDAKISDTGFLTSAATGNKLFLDAGGNLTENNNSGTAVQANVNGGGSVATGDVLFSMAAGGGQGGTITVGAGATAPSYVYTAGTATAAATNLHISNAALASKVQTANTAATPVAATIDVDGGGSTVAYAVAAGTTGGPTGAITQGGLAVNVNLQGQLTTNTAESLFLHDNGNVTDAASNVVYNDSAKTGSFTLNAKSNATVTADPLAALDEALSKVDKLRSSLGAVQNRFDSTIANLGTTVVNLSSSRSRIEDADYAVEVSNMTRAQILQQAGTSVLSQANQTTQGVLSLLR